MDVSDRNRGALQRFHEAKAENQRERPRDEEGSEEVSDETQNGKQYRDPCVRVRHPAGISVHGLLLQPSCLEVG